LARGLINKRAAAFSPDAADAVCLNQLDFSSQHFPQWLTENCSFFPLAVQIAQPFFSPQSVRLTGLNISY
jgi:hypothetical protein